MSISISTDHLLLDDQGLTITAFGYDISWLMNSVGTESQGYEFYRELTIERLRHQAHVALDKEARTMDRDRGWQDRGWVGEGIGSKGHRPIR